MHGKSQPITKIANSWYLLGAPCNHNSNTSSNTIHGAIDPAEVMILIIIRVEIIKTVPLLKPMVTYFHKHLFEEHINPQ